MSCESNNSRDKLSNNADVQGHVTGKTLLATANMFLSGESENSISLFDEVDHFSLPLPD
jgi:hypothetical protein